MTTKHPLGAESPQAKRMRAIRGAVGYEHSQLEFAHLLKLEKSRWNNFENGYPVSRDVQRRLLDKFPWLTRDYIEDGRIDGIAMVWLRKLGELQDNENPSAINRKRA